MFNDCTVSERHYLTFWNVRNLEVQVYVAAGSQTVDVLIENNIVLLSALQKNSTCKIMSYHHYLFFYDFSSSIYWEK